MNIRLPHLRLLLLLAMLLLSLATCTPTPQKAAPPAPPQQHITCQPDDAIFPNPERGFYRAYDPPYTGKMGGQEKLHAPFKLAELKALRDSPEAITLIRDNILIPRKFWDAPLSQDYLAELQHNFDTVRAAGMKSVIRFLYDWSMNNRDPDEKTVLSHLDQLQPLLQKNADVIAWLQAGLFGGCGEANASDHNYVALLHPAPKGKLKWQGLTDAGRRIYLHELNILPADRMMTVRYPRLKWDLLSWPHDAAPRLALNNPREAFTTAPAARIGFYNEGFMGDENHYAMFQMKGEADFTAADSEFVVHEGEISKFTPYNTKPHQVIADMTRFHQTALNAGGDDWKKVSDQWKANGDYDQILRRLGYRFELLTLTAPTQLAPGDTLELQLQIKNTGFARLMNPRNIEIILHTDTNTITLPIKTHIDLRKLLPAPAQTTTLTLSAPLPKNLARANYHLLLNLPDLAPTLHNCPEYAIRLANKNTWNADTGYNDLHATLTIK